MRPMLPVFAVTLGCSLFAMEAAAQSTYAYPSGGGYVAGAVVAGQAPSNPRPPARCRPARGPGGVVGQPIVVGEVAGQPIATGGIIGQPVDSGVVIGGPITHVGTSAITPVQGPVLPYSYWVSHPAPSRVYVEYGPGDQFPFHGRPYGSPNDRWSWYYMGGGPSRYLAKYYYPILQ